MANTPAATFSQTDAPRHMSLMDIWRFPFQCITTRREVRAALP
jgi:hypothetical protein